jgi:hypothetical protein
MSTRFQAGILNPEKNKRITNTKRLTELTKPPKSINSNIYTNNKIQYYSIINPIENVFITYLNSTNSNKPIKILQQSSKDFREGLNNNKKNLKNFHLLFGDWLKSLLIQEQQYNEPGVFIGNAKIWLVYNTNLGFFDYVIEINPSQNFVANTNKISKTIIPFLIYSLDISFIINALKKFGVKNIDEEKVKQNSKDFRWSFSSKSIPRYRSAFSLFRKVKNPMNPMNPMKTFNNLNNNGPALPLNNNNGPALPLNNNNGPALPLNNNNTKFKPITPTEKKNETKHHYFQ